MSAINGSSANGVQHVDPTVPPPDYKITVKDDTQAQLLEDIPGVHTRPLWTQMSVLVPPKPGPKAVVHKWA